MDIMAQLSSVSALSSPLEHLSLFLLALLGNQDLKSGASNRGPVDSAGFFWSVLSVVFLKVIKTLFYIFDFTLAISHEGYPVAENIIFW